MIEEPPLGNTGTKVGYSLGLGTGPVDRGVPHSERRELPGFFLGWAPTHQLFIYLSSHVEGYLLVALANFSQSTQMHLDAQFGGRGYGLWVGRLGRSLASPV